VSNRQLIKVLVLCGVMGAGFAPARVVAAEADDRKLRAEQLQGTLGTYSGAPRMTNGRIDLPRLVRELVDCHGNTYSFAIHGVETDWNDLQTFLPMAREHGIRVWGSVVPPSESPPRSKAFAEPFKLDYERWAVEFAKLSVRETNLVAWSIDDFSANGKFYTPEYLKKMLDAAHAINPRLAFVPCCYYKGITPDFVKNYAPLLDGFLFPYRHESGGANLTAADLTEPELKKIKGMVGAEFPVVIDVYASAHSRLGKSTPEYVEQVMTAGKSSADGVMVYCHQDPNLYPEKYQIVKKLFTQWSKDAK
jgi:hypothetical protein